MRRFILGLWCVLLSSAGAVSSGQGNLTPAEKTKVRENIALMRAIMPTCLGQSLTTLLDQAGAQVTYGQVDGADVTLDQALTHLATMLAGNHLKKQASLGEGATTAPGDAGKRDVTMGSAILTKLCAATQADEMYQKVYMGVVLLNELTHVWQNAAGTTSVQRCDAERDSDRLSRKFLDAIIAGLKDPATGAAYATVGAVPNAGLQGCLTGAGVTNAQMAGLLARIEHTRTWLDGRMTRYFENRLTPPIAATWLDYYDDGTLGLMDLTGSTNAVTGQEEVTLTGMLGNTRTYAVPLGHQVVQVIGLTAANGRWMLVVVTKDATGRIFISAWQDTDDDGLPEHAASGGPWPANFIPAGSTPVVPYSVGAHAIAEVVPSTAGLEPYVLIHDPQNGALFGWRVDMQSATANVTYLGQDPALQGSARYFQGWTVLAPGFGRAIFCDTPGPFADGGSAAIWFDIDVFGASLVPGAGPNQTLAEAKAPHNPLSVSGLAAGASAVELFGNPGSVIALDSVGRGVVQPVTQGSAGPDGATGSIPLSNPIQGNDLYLVQGLNAMTVFVPRSGRAIDARHSDEDLDGTLDRVDLTVAPPRLHLSLGLAGQTANDPVRNHVYELAMSVEPTMIGIWNQGARGVHSTSGYVDLVRVAVPGYPAPILCEPRDLDGDGLQDEAVFLIRETGATSFSAGVVSGLTQPNPALQGPFLLEGIEPQSFAFADVDGDLDLDVTVRDQYGVDGFRLINDGTGQFAPEGGVLSLLTQGFGDLTINAAPLSMFPGATQGWTLFSFDTTPNGPWWGITPDQFTFDIAVMPAVPGSPLHYPATPGMFPEVPWAVPPGALIQFQGQSAVAVQVVTDAAFGILYTSNVATVTM